MTMTWTKVSSIDIDLSDDDAIAAVALKTGITDPDTDADVSDGDLLIWYDGGGSRRGYQYHAPTTPTQEEITARNRAAFNAERNRLIAEHLCDHARQRIQDEVARGVSPLTTKYVNRCTYMNDLLDLPETQVNFDTVIAASDFDLETDIDWPSEPE